MTILKCEHTIAKIMAAIMLNRDPSKSTIWQGGHMRVCHPFSSLARCYRHLNDRPPKRLMNPPLHAVTDAVKCSVLL